MNNRMEKACFNILVSSGNIAREKLEEVYNEAENSKFSFTELIVQKGVLKEPELLKIYSKNLGIPYLSLKVLTVEQAVIDKIPVKFAWYYKFFPIQLTERKLTIALSRLLDVNALDEIRLGLGLDIDFVFAASFDIEEMLKKYYGLGATTVEKILSEDTQPRSAGKMDRADEGVEDIEKLAETASVGQLVNQIILDAFQKRASDIHIEPLRGDVRIRYRIDGELQEAKVPPEMKKFYLPILSRIKIMANLNIVERRLPQDGKARVKTRDQSLDLRISTMPTPHGESMAIRILPHKTVFNLNELGFGKEQVKIFEDLIYRPNGIIFVTGPTGSGKSTTLYAAMNTLNTIKKKIITIEDPVEYEIEGITQIQVQSEVGLTFSRGLRSVLRHDPDVMMVGEVRDLETADIAIRSALTGHLILSTLHTNDAATGVTRLLDIGVEPYLVASSVIAFIAQRLVRVICSNCKEVDKEVTPDIKHMIRKELKLGPVADVKVYRGKGCEECNRTGYSGRVAIYEVLLMNEVIRKLIFMGSSAEEIKRRARQLGMKTLRQDGWKKALDGITTPAEILKVAPNDDEVLELSEKLVLPEEQGVETVIPDPETQAASSDNRKFERVQIKFHITYRTIGAEAGKETEFIKQELTAQTENISAGGMAFITNHGLKEGDVLDLKLDLKDGEKPVQCLGKVLRVTQLIEGEGDGEHFVFRIAITFLAISSSERLRIENFCKNETRNENI